MTRLLLLAAFLLVTPAVGLAQAPAKPKAKAKAKASAPKYPQRPEPTHANVRYGDDSTRQVFDVWLAESEEPTPLALYIHGGGWVGGDKRKYGAEAIQPLLDEGISVASINYRLISEAMEQGVQPPVKAPLHDAARALQTIRSRARQWNIDPARIAASGSSAGACTSLWLALHDDLADPNSDDPVARESTRPMFVAVVGAQTSLDPQQVRSWIPNAVYGGHAFGFAGQGRQRGDEFELVLKDRERVLPWIKEYSPIELVSSDDPPIYLNYPNQKVPPRAGQEEKDPTHSAMYGVGLKEALDEAGVENSLVYPGNNDSRYSWPTKIFIAKLKPE
jgi:acetyl esterase/lipase